MGIPDFELVAMRPLDSFFFGRSRGLDLSSSATSFEFPLPWTVSGALLGAHASITEDLGTGRKLGELTWDEDIEERGELTGFMFYGPFLIWEGKEWFRPPEDLRVKFIHSRTGKLYRDQLPALVPEEKEFPGWIDHETLEKYSNGEKVDLKVEGPRISEERRLGTHLDDLTRTVKEGFIYSAIHRRLPPGSSIGVLITGKRGQKLANFSLVRLGGEARVSRVERSQWRPGWLDDRGLSGGDVVKVVLLSPAIYRRNGENVRVPPIDRLRDKVKLCRLGGRTLVIGRKPTRVSGWDMRRKRARKMYSAVPPGTVYYLRLKGSMSRWELTLDFWKLSLYWERGFGSPLVALSGGVRCE